MATKKTRSLDNILSLLEFRFLKYHPPLTPEQQQEARVLAEKYNHYQELLNQPLATRETWWSAFADFNQSRDLFIARHRFDEPPYDPVAAMRWLCRQEEIVIEQAGLPKGFNLGLPFLSASSRE